MTTPAPIELAVEVPGTPEEVWRTVATGPGISSWFVPVNVEERPGGAMRMDVGGTEVETGRVAVWEPPRRVVFEGQGLTFDWMVEGEPPGPCTVRLVNAGFDDDARREGMAGGWPLFLGNLRLHLTFFAGRSATAAVPVATLPGPHAGAWAAFCATLGVAPSAVAGDPLRPGRDGVPPLSATVASVVRTAGVTAYLLLVDNPVPGTGFVASEGDGDEVTCSLYLYLYGDEAAAHGDRWRAWMATAFPPPAGVPA